MSFFDWFKTRRPVDTAAEIRRQIALLNAEHAALIKRRDDLSLDAIRDSSSAVQWLRLDEAQLAATKQMAVLATALPRAEANEAEAARQAELSARAEQFQKYLADTEEAQRWLETLLARLPSAEQLTHARDLRDRLAEQATPLKSWSADVRVRRPLDPLHRVWEGLNLRVERIQRARWIGKSPITLNDKRAIS